MEKINYFVPSSYQIRRVTKEHLYFDYVCHETIRLYYRKPNSGLQLQLFFLSNARTYIFQTQDKLQLGLPTETINASLGLVSLMTKNVQL
jgi:hypothetical protein